MPSLVFRNGCISVSVKYLHVKKDGTCYYRRRVPSGLEGHYGGKPLVMESLKTRDLKVAAGEVAKRAERHDAFWRTLGSQEGRTLGLTTKETTAAAHALLSSLLIEPGDASGPQPETEPLAEYLQFRHGQAWYEASEDDRTRMLTPVEQEAVRLYTQDPKKPRVLMSEALALYLKSHDSGDLKKFQDDNTRAVNALIDVAGDKPLETYAKQDALNFRDKLLAKGRKTRTVRRELSRIVTIFNTTTSEYGLDYRNWFEGVRITKEGKDADERESYTTAEIRIIAAACRAKDDEIRHIVSMILDTGARASEVAGLRAEDICLGEDVPYMRLKVLDDGSVRRLKNDNSKRDVPLVGEALWAAQQALKSLGKRTGWLFPRYASDTAVKGTHASNAVNKWMRGLPGVSKDKSSHCFRHSMRDRLRDVEAPLEIQDLIGGWGSRSVGQQYGRGYQLKVLWEQMSKVVLLPKGFA